MSICLCSGRAAVSEISMLLNTYLPFTYVQLVAMLAQLTQLVFAVGCGYTAAVALNNQQWALLACQILQVVLVPLMLQSILDLCAVMVDPFGSDVLDFSFLQFHIALADMCAGFCSDVPETILEAIPFHIN